MSSHPGSSTASPKQADASITSSSSSNHADGPSYDQPTAQTQHPAGGPPAAGLKSADVGGPAITLDVTVTGMRSFRSRRRQPSSAAAASRRPPGQARSSRKQLTTAAAAEAVAWQPLGRAGFILAALSSSGLLTEYLPAPEANWQDFRDSSSSTSSSSSSSAGRSGGGALGPTGSTPSGESHSEPHSEPHRGSRASRPAVVPAPAAEAVAVQELAWLQTAAVAGHVDAQLALADR
jgi:hypothetical protein